MKKRKQLSPHARKIYWRLVRKTLNVLGCNSDKAEKLCKSLTKSERILAMHQNPIDLGEELAGKKADPVIRAYLDLITEVVFEM